jgi:hypothetical protein
LGTCLLSPVTARWATTSGKTYEKKGAGVAAMQDSRTTSGKTLEKIGESLQSNTVGPKLVLNSATGVPGDQVDVHTGSKGKLLYIKPLPPLRSKATKQRSQLMYKI